MKKLFYLIVTIAILGLLVSGCIPVVPPAEQNEPGTLPSKAIINVNFGESIQDAIDAASDGDIIYVHEGTYDECIVIDGVDLSLIAVGDATIVASSTNCKTIEIYNSTCTIDGFTVEGGLLGIYAKEMVDVTICNNTVSGYQKNGITVNSEPAIGRIYNNTIIGGGPIGYPLYAQNGIQIGYGATATIKGNAVEGNWYEGPDWMACGILIFEADDVTVQENSVEGSETGIAIESWGWFFPSANKNKIIRNTINNAVWGVSVMAVAWEGYTISDVSANNNKVTNNTIEAAVDGAIGVYVGTWEPNSLFIFSAIAENNKVINNKINGYEVDIVDDGIASKVHANAVK